MTLNACMASSSSLLVSSSRASSAAAVEGNSPANASFGVPWPTRNRRFLLLHFSVVEEGSLQGLLLRFYLFFKGEFTCPVSRGGSPPPKVPIPPPLPPARARLSSRSSPFGPWSQCGIFYCFYAGNIFSPPAGKTSRPARLRRVCRWGRRRGRRSQSACSPCWWGPQRPP